MTTDFSLLTFIFFLPNVVLMVKRSSKSIPNSDFKGFEINESELNRVNSFSLIQCSTLCTDTSSCQSFNYNKISRTCVLFDNDFTDFAATRRTYGVDWSYYYVIRDKELKPVICNAPYTPSDICSRYCLYYIHHTGDYPFDYARLELECSGYPGGQMVIIDRQLKQHCVKEFLVQVGALQDDIYIQGKRNETTNLWTYNDGTAITYFNWNSGEPDNRTDEIYMGFMRPDYRWNDVYDNPLVVHATVCQQT